MAVSRKALVDRIGVEDLAAARLAINAGHADEARVLLVGYLENAPADYRAWLMLAWVAPSPRDSLEYVNRAADLQPGHPTVEGARRWAEGRLIAEPSPSPLTPPALSLVHDLVLIEACALLLLPLVSLGSISPLLALPRLLLGLAYILIVPGYCITAALFPQAEDLDRIERFGLSIGLSIAWIPILALILNALPWGLHLWPVLIGELVSIALFSALALWRRVSLPGGQAFAPTLSWQPRTWWRTLPRSDRLTSLFIFAAVMLTTLALAWTFLIPTPDEYMTEFYMLGSNGLAEGFPREAIVGDEIGVTLGLVNQERSAHNYRIEIWVKDPWTEGRQLRVAQAGPFDLARGKSHEERVAWRMPWPGEDQEVDLLLFDGNASVPYRRLQLWLDVKP